MLDWFAGAVASMSAAKDLVADLDALRLRVGEQLGAAQALAAVAQFQGQFGGVQISEG